MPPVFHSEQFKVQILVFTPPHLYYGIGFTRLLTTMLKGRGPIILVALIVAFCFSLTIHYVTASNSVESRVAQILDKNSDIIRLQGEKKELCKGLGDYRHNDLDGICEKNTKKVLPTNEIE